MIRVSRRVSRAIAATAFASGLTVTLTAAALAGGAYLKIGDIKGESTDSTHKGEIEIESWSWGATSGGADRTGNIKYTWKVEEGEKATSAGGEAADAAARKSLGRLKTSDVTLERGVSESAGGVSVAAGDIDGDGRAELAAPLGQGSVRVKVKMPWPACRVGTRYPSLELGDGTQVYTLRDAVVTSCGSTDGVPTGQISFNYAKVEVRGWNPDKKD